MDDLVQGQRVVGLRSAYVVDGVLGAGGFGQAFAATSDDGRTVVLKQLRVARMDDWKALELFEREARALASLHHPNIPRHHEFFATDGDRSVEPSRVAELGPGVRLVLVQDRVEGRSLMEHVEARERLAADQAQALLTALLEVLAYLHGLQPPIVHRDIKPANIVVTPTGKPMLVDFGAIQDRMRRDSELGSTTVGTFGFFALEQMLGKAQPASDLYSLGMTMMVVLTHRAPEELPIDPATSKVLVRAACPGLPEPLTRALEGMLEPVVGNRLPSASAVLGVLAAAAMVPRLPGPVVPTPRRLPAAAHLGPICGAVAVAATLYGLLFDSLSESELVAVSFYWVPLLVFGLGARLTDSIAGALAWTAIGTGALAVFIYGIFPAL